MKTLDLVTKWVRNFLVQLDDLVDRIRNSVQLNGFYIILSLLFPLMLFGIGAGKEIFLVLLNRTQFYNNFLIDLAFFILSYCLWIIPAFSIYFFRKNIFGDEVTTYQEELAFHKLAKIYNGVKTTSFTKKQIAVRYLSTLPFLIFIFALTYNYFFAHKFISNFEENRILNTSIIVFILIITIYFLYSGLELITKKIYRIRNIKFKLFGIYLMFILLNSIRFKFFNDIANRAELTFYSFFHFKQDFNPYFLLFTHLFAFFLSYFYLRYNELNPFEISNKQFYNKAKFNHLVVIFSLSFMIFIFYLLNSNGVLGYLSPIVVTLILISFLIIAIEALISAPSQLIQLFPDNKNKGIKRIIFKFFLIGLVVLFILNIFNNPNLKTIKTTIRTENHERQELETYFEKWIEDRSYAKKNGDTIEVYLVSGQGGGSRAGAWFLMNMLNRESMDPQFYNNIFSLSTVSGSTSGANMFLAIQDIKQRYIASKELNDELETFKITKSIYNKNYVSGALYGLLITDLFTGFDRNNTLQLEEKKALQNNFQGENAIEIRRDIENFFEKDYMHLYKSGSTKTPLFFINAAVSSTGIKAVFSPVKVSNSNRNELIPQIFSAVDLYESFNRFSKVNEKFDLPLITCVNQSQAFPLANSYNYLNGAGRISDGGSVDNTGIGTSVEIYKILLKKRELLERRCKVKVKFIFLNLFNSKIFEPDIIPINKSSITDVFTGLLNGIFNISQPAAVKSQKEILYRLKNDTIFDLKFEEDVALTRLLSDSTIAKIFSKLQNKQFHIITKQERKLDFPKVYIQYNSNNIKNISSFENTIINSKIFNLKPSEAIVNLTLKKNQIRYFNTEDKEIAEKLSKIIGDSLVLIDFSDREGGSRVPLNQVEIWLK